jgi:prepilin-type N-terminal cleavage/methylation domain-containing protein
MIMMNKNGFTLIELLVVISIISLLSSVVFASLSDAREKGRIAAGQKFDSSVDHSIRDTLILEWSFENNFNDSSGRGNVPTPHNSPTFTPEGMKGNALSLNGSNQWIGFSGGVFPDAGQCDFTITMWSYNEGMSSSLKGGLFIGAQGTASGITYLSYNDSNLELRIGRPGNIVVKDVGGSFSDKWMHTAVVFEDRIPTLYLDGQQVWRGAQYPNCFNMGDILVGQWERFFNGKIDEIKMYQKGLNASEVQKLYAEGLSTHQTLAQN